MKQFIAFLNEIHLKEYLKAKNELKLCIEKEQSLGEELQYILIERQIFKGILEN